jgi:hypothetical protein
MGIICAVPISLFFWSIILLIYKAIFWFIWK